MFMTKFLRYAEKLGLNPEELLEMNMLDAILKIDNTADMWKLLRGSV